MRRCKGTFDVLFGIEQQIEEGGNGGAVQQRNQGRTEIWHLTQQELPMKAQAVRIERIRQEEFSWQSTATWEQLWEQDKGRLSRSQEMKEELPKHGRTSEEEWKWQRGIVVHPPGESQWN